MRILQLQRPALLEAPGYRPFVDKHSRIEIVPGKNGSGWQWDTGQHVLPVSPLLLDRRARRARLKHGDATLEIFEHIGPLRWLGLEDIVIRSTPWPPYHGRPLELWESVERAGLKNTEGKFQWVTPTEKIVSYWDDGNPKRFTEIIPNYEPELDIVIHIDYKGLGTFDWEVKISNEKGTPTLTEAFERRSQGWPSWLYYPSLVADFLGVWGHHDHICWPQDAGIPGFTLIDFAAHRLVDLLGLLAIATPSHHLLAGKVVSYCSGHAMDLLLCKRLSEAELELVS